MDLLRALVSFDPNGTSRQTLTEALWPAAETPAASRKASDITLHRLRRVLGDERAVRLEHGTVSFERDVAGVACTPWKPL